MGTSSFTNSGLSYLFSTSGWVRLFNILLGLVCIILSYNGFDDDFEEKHEVYWIPYLTYYGLGYKQEGANILNLTSICLCCVISVIFLLLLVCVKDAVHNWKAWNRFINLFLAIVLLIGWICGLLGFLLFRQGCCRVEMFSSERITHESMGYRQSCLCMINPQSDPKRSFPVLLNQDAQSDIDFVKAQPHHFYGHVASLVLMLLNVVLYFGAFLRVD